MTHLLRVFPIDIWLRGVAIGGARPAEGDQPERFSRVSLPARGSGIQTNSFPWGSPGAQEGERKSPAQESAMKTELSTDHADKSFFHLVHVFLLFCCLLHSRVEPFISKAAGCLLFSFEN